MDQKDLNAIIALVLADAQVRRDSAGYGGRMDDGGASRMEEQVKFFRAGQNQELPYDWKVYAEMHSKISDVEYEEYLRLKKKFEDTK